MILNKMDFYEEILRHKKTYKLGNRELGDLIGKSSDAFRMALNAKSLTTLEIREIQKHIESLKIDKAEAKNFSEDPFMDGLVEKLKHNLKFNEYLDWKINESNKKLVMAMAEPEIAKVKRRLDENQPKKQEKEK